MLYFYILLKDYIERNKYQIFTLFMSKKSLQYRLTINIVAIFSIVIITTTTVIYLAYEKWMKNSEISSLENKTLLASFYYLEKDEISQSEHQSIQNKLVKTISRKDIAIYDESFSMVSGLMFKNNEITPSFLKEIIEEGQGSFITSKYFYNALYYRDNEGNFVVVTREDKTDFNQHLQSLFIILFMVSTGGIILIYIFSVYIGRFAYEPITQVVEQLKERNSENFETPVIIPNSYTEIDDLVTTYNHFIKLLSQIFAIQKNFTDYVSHELRTPIAAIMGTSEISIADSINEVVSKQDMLKIRQYVTDLNQSLDHLLLLSGGKSFFENKPLRIDELIWDVTENAIQYHRAKIKVEIEVVNQDDLIMLGDEKLLKLAINNLIENSIKYSNNQEIIIKIFQEEHHVKIHIKDYGIGILPEDVPLISNHFVRGKNVTNISGKGIGLSLARLIFKLHHIEMDIISLKSPTIISLKFIHQANNLQK